MPYAPHLKPCALLPHSDVPPDSPLETASGTTGHERPILTWVSCPRDARRHNIYVRNVRTVHFLKGPSCLLSSGISGEVMNPPREAYVGVFLVALATLTYEILLTRLFSVTMWHHFAFMAVSLAMFGMTVGAIAVYLAPGWFTPHKALFHMGLAAQLFALSVLAGFLAQLSIRFVPSVSWSSFGSLTAIYSVASLPFVWSGACITLALTHFTPRVGSLYASDLIGAALGCLLFSAVISFSDASTTAFVVGLLGALSSLVFWRRTDARRLLIIPVALCIGLAGGTGWSAFRALEQEPLIRLQWVKGKREAPPIYEDWNAFSRVTVSKPAAGPMHVWGLSPRYRGSRFGRQLLLNNDAGGGTYLVGFDGDLSTVEFLKYDIASFVHRLRPGSDVFIVGAGGGRDVLAALAFDQPSVTAAEINPNVVKAVNGPFGEFTGHLDRDPRVTFVAEDARSFAARTDKHYGLIQFSFVDTYAGTAAGAFALTENSLYTVEAWRMFLERLEADGWISITRYYFSDLPVEFYRLASLASAALRASGENEPRRHIIVLRHQREVPPAAFVRAKFVRAKFAAYDSGTLLVSRKALSADEVDRIRAQVHRMGHDIAVDPQSTSDPHFEQVMSAPNPTLSGGLGGLDISAPTDDRPYVNNMLRPQHLFDAELTQRGNLDANRRATFVLAALLAIVVVLSITFIIAPLLLSRSARRLPAGRHVLFFCAIGFGFMLIEIAQMQRLGIFLGHPSYGLTVVLFTLLLSGGVGSWLSQAIAPHRVSTHGGLALLGLLIVLAGLGLVTVPVIEYFTPFGTSLRILVSVALLFPAGVFMGMAFPLGMRQASTSVHELTPWLFGVNGATSVCAAVIAAAISLAVGFSVTYWAGVLAYVGAFAAFAYIARVTFGEED